MTPIDIQTKMGLIFEELKNVEVKLQNARADLNKALQQEETTKEGLVEVNKRLKETKDGDIVFLERVVAAKTDVETVEKFHDQSVAHRCIIQATIMNLEKFQSKLQEGYNSLGVELVKADQNVVYFGV